MLPWHLAAESYHLDWFPSKLHWRVSPHYDDGVVVRVEREYPGDSLILHQDYVRCINQILAGSGAGYQSLKAPFELFTSNTQDCEPVFFSEVTYSRFNDFRYRRLFLHQM